ncbi:hypothetical protein E4695_14980 [Alcaligenaceae bacterium 429]|nr:hypothetical protein E4695_14980 [Alcaligenaceae bacterium 429]
MYEKSSTLPSDYSEGNSSSITHSGISGVQITITDEAKQHLPTGETVEDRLISLSTDAFTDQNGRMRLRLRVSRASKGGFDAGSAVRGLFAEFFQKALIFSFIKHVIFYACLSDRGSNK